MRLILMTQLCFRCKRYMDGYLSENGAIHQPEYIKAELKKIARRWNIDYGFLQQYSIESLMFLYNQRTTMNDFIEKKMIFDTLTKIFPSEINSVLQKCINDLANTAPDICARELEIISQEMPFLWKLIKNFCYTEEYSYLSSKYVENVINYLSYDNTIDLLKLLSNHGRDDR